MQCVILAAGEGKRMRPLTSSRPKGMLPVANRPILEYIINAVRDAGITEILLVVGYHEQAIRAHFGDGSAFGVSIRYAVQRRQMGTADAVRAAENDVKGDFLLLNGDMIIRTEDLRAIASAPSPCLASIESTHPEDFGTLETEGALVTGLAEKSHTPPSNTINAGIYHFSEDIFAIIQDLSLSERGEYELTDALSQYIDEGQLHHIPISYWCDIGEPWHLLDANEEILKTAEDEIHGTIEAGVTIHGTVQLGEGSIICAGTYIEGTCIFGKNCKIGPNAYIRGTTAIGNDCHIGNATEIKNSIIFSGTKIPHFNYIGDSIIGSETNFGAGAKVANLRHDNRNVWAGGRDTGRRKFGVVVGDQVKLGINCSLNIGTIIGSRTHVAPNTFVEGVIREDTKIGR